MLFDVVFLGGPIAIAFWIGAYAAREADKQAWRSVIYLGIYCIFYLTAGREVLVYISTLLMMGSGWTSNIVVSPTL